MNFSRRCFLGSLAAVVASPRWVRAGTPLAKVGILSDPHVSADPKTVAPLLKAFRRFAAEGVGTVVISGDVCEVGTLAELASVMNAWRTAFPDGKNALGQKVDPFFVWGNHDYHDASYLRGRPVTEEDRKNHIFYNKDVAWKMVTGEEKMPGEVFLRKSHGLTFVGAHWKHQHELGAFLEAHAAEIPSDRPVIYVQHPHPKGTCFHGWATVDDGRNLAALLAHPNFFCVSGHSHVSVSFDDSLWLGGFAAMGAGSMRIAGGRRDVYNFVRKGGKETRHMPTPPAGGGQQASILSVYPDRVVVSRHEYRYDEPLGEDWDIPFPFPHDAAKPHVIAEAAAAPEFPAGATVEVAQRDGLLHPVGTPVRQVQLTFPSASSVGPHSRVVRYCVVITKAADGVRVLERVVAPSLSCLSERQSLKEPGTCAFGLDELPHGERLVASVTPLNAGGKAGKSISGDILLMRQ